MEENINILTVETSENVCSAALGNETKLLGEITLNKPFSHNERLAWMVNWLLTEQNMEMSDISHVFISAGPGSYTGLRIGFSFVRGLIYANKTKLIPVPTPEIYAHKGTKGKTDEYSVLAIMDARRNEIYVSEYSYAKNILTEIEPVQIVTIENFLEEYTSRTARIAGSGLSIINKHL